jgi:putative ABC transport system permease protein
MMKYLHLIWASLFRRKTRTILTLVSIVAAFLLFGLLDAVRLSFQQAGQSAVGAERLQTSSRLSFIETLPYSLGNQIEAVPGVRGVAYANWFGGVYQTPRNQVFSFAVSPNYLDLYPEAELGAAERARFEATANAVVAGEALVKRYGWKLGDTIPLQSLIYADRSGSKNWSFQLVGIMHARDRKSGGFYDAMLLLHWKTFDETTPANGGTVGWYVTRVADVAQADRVARAIDALSANSDHETKTQTEQAATAAFLKQLVDIGLLVSSIMGAVFFTLLLLTGNTMMQAVRERTTEIAVLKTIGFPRSAVLGMVLAESVLLLLVGGVIGIGLVSVLAPAITEGSGRLINLPPVGAGSWLLGLALMLGIGLAVGAIPALRAMRVNLVAALAGRQG